MQGLCDEPCRRNKPRSLAGATILQLVPALRDDPPGRAAVDIALTLLHSPAPAPSWPATAARWSAIARLRRRMAADAERHDQSLRLRSNARLRPS
jgi:hypothetical protein